MGTVVCGRQLISTCSGVPKRAASASLVSLRESGAQITSCPSASVSHSSAPTSSAASNMSSPFAALAA